MFGFLFFLGIYLLGDSISGYFTLPIPGSIIGLVLVLIMLITRGRVDAPLKEAADFFLRYLALMLVPIGVCVIRLVNPAPVGIWKLEAVLVLSLIVGALLTAKIMQALLAFRRAPQTAFQTRRPSRYRSVVR